MPNIASRLTPLRARGAVTAVLILSFAGATLFIVAGICSLLVVIHAALYAGVTEHDLDVAAESDGNGSSSDEPLMSELMSGKSGSGAPGGIEMLTPPPSASHKV